MAAVGGLDDFIDSVPSPSTEGGFSDYLDTPAHHDDSDQMFSAPLPEKPASVPSSPAMALHTSVPSSFMSAAAPSYGEDALAKYKRDHDEFLADKEQHAVENRNAMLDKAHADFEEVQQKNAADKAKRQAKNRDEEKKFLRERDAVLSGASYNNDWERVASLVDLKAAVVGRDTSRLRKLMIELKH